MSASRYLTLAAVARRLERAIPTITAMIARGELEKELLETGDGTSQLIVLRESVERYEAAQQKAAVA